MRWRLLAISKSILVWNDRNEEKASNNRWQTMHIWKIVYMADVNISRSKYGDYMKLWHIEWCSDKRSVFRWFWIAILTF